MSRIKCFFVEPTGKCRLYVRRYASNSECPANRWVHGAQATIGEVEAEFEDCGYLKSPAELDRGDPRWPKKCDHCDYEFSDSDPWQTNVAQLYMCGEREECWTGPELPPGAMFYPEWLQPKHIYSDAVNDAGAKRWQPGPDGKVLMVVTPGGHWIVDSRASNCTMPHDNEHRCWVRHGSPPDVNVDKNGLTCGAGAGSIQCGSYHGFLRDGWLEEC